MESFGSWSVLTTNFLVILYLALGGIIFAAMLELAKGKWRLQIRFLAVSSASLLPIAFVLLLVLLGNGEATFPWLAEARQNPDMHLPGWHNYAFLVTRNIVGFLAVAGLSAFFVKSMCEVDSNPTPQGECRLRWATNILPFAYVIYGTMVAWDFEMTLVPGWHSAEYGAYQFQSGFHGFLAAFVIFLYFMDKSGKLKKQFDPKIFNYLAQFILGMTILWVYFYFVQYLVFWYGRLPHDMDRYLAMIEEGYMPLGIAFFVFKFVVPFFSLIFTPVRHNPTLIMLVSVFVFLGTWLERYVWVSGSVASEFYHMPMSSWQDIVATLFVIIAAAFTVRQVMLRCDMLAEKI